jgi:CheY-like chemotaxis protein
LPGNRQPMQTEQAKSEKKSILVVDDDLELSLIFQELLEASGYQVFTASDGILALKQVLYQDVDAILCDLRMPGLEGDLFYSAVERAKPELCRRFIFITGAADDPKYNAFLSQVKAPVLHKPVKAATLLETLQILLRSQA